MLAPAASPVQTWTMRLGVASVHELTRGGRADGVLPLMRTRGLEAPHERVRPRRLRIGLSRPSREGRVAALPSLGDQTERVIDRREACTARSSRPAWSAPCFDVVIVGGGAAGCVVSARLAASASQSVLLLEAGPDLRAKLPDELRDGWRMTEEFDWGYASEPDARGEIEDLRRGKLLGGTSWVT